MYIKLTRFDNRPVWLNAAFVVTVEPRRDGSGAIVVPIGDGLDYDVRESPEEVLRMLDGCPAPQVVPVPVSDCLTKTPADVSPEPERKIPEPERKPPEEKPSPAPAEETVKPTKKAVKSRKTAAEKKPKPVKKPKLDLSDDEVVRLGKLAPKTVAKVKNTLMTQFHVENPSVTIAALEAKGVLSLVGKGDTVIIAGSTPKDVEKSYPAKLIAEIHRRGGVRQRQRRAVDRRGDILQDIGNRADMILMSVSEENSLQLVLIVN